MSYKLNIDFNISTKSEQQQPLHILHNLKEFFFHNIKGFFYNQLYLHYLTAGDNYF